MCTFHFNVFLLFFFNFTPDSTEIRDRKKRGVVDIGVLFDRVSVYVSNK